MKHCHKIIQREFAKLMIVCRLYLWLQTTSIRTIEEITNHNVLWYDIKCLECVWTTCAQHIYVLLNLIFAEICLTVMAVQRFGDASFRIKYPIQHLLSKKYFCTLIHFVWGLLTYNYMFSIFCSVQKWQYRSNTLQQKVIVSWWFSDPVISAILFKDF